MNHQSQFQRRDHKGLPANPNQEELIQMYADRIGNKIGCLISEVIVDSLTLLWLEKPGNQSIIGVSEKSIPHDKPNIQEPSTLDRLLNAPEVANRLGISKSKAYQLMLRGELPTVRIGKSVRVRPQDLEDCINKYLEG